MKNAGAGQGPVDPLHDEIVVEFSKQIDLDGHAPDNKRRDEGEDEFIHSATVVVL